MKSDLSHFGKQIAMKDGPCSENDGDWTSVMPIPEDEIEYDEDCPPLESGVYSEPIHRFNGRIIPPRKSPTDPYDPEVLAFMRSLTPLVQMEPAILGGMPVFKNTLVPIKRMFDYLLRKKTMDEFLTDYPAVSRDLAIGVLESEATLFYEEISKAMDSAAMPSSLPR
ncbi:hypothetical protein RugamoR64_01950 [Duganella rhizosphaerae]